MPRSFPSWLIVDADRNVDQYRWLVQYVSTNIRQNVDRIGPFSREVSNAFEKHFPASEIARVFDHNRFVRWETQEEALERCKHRSQVSFYTDLNHDSLTYNLSIKQCSKWVQNHYKKYLQPEDSIPKIYHIQSAKDISNVPRAKSARDLFIADHPEIQTQVNAEMTAQGITNKSELRARINRAYTDAMALCNNIDNYHERAAENKAQRAAERQNEKEKQDIGFAPSSGSEIGRKRFDL